MGDIDLAIRNGIVVTAADSVRCDVGIKGGKIVALAERIGDADRSIDAKGKLLLPGGIDAHVHIDEPPFYGVQNVDDFTSGSISAACGGTTTLIPFAQQEAGHSLRSSIQSYHGKAEGKAIIDYAFHVILINPDQSVLGQELPSLVDDGYSSYKVFMTYDGMALEDRQILATLDAARRSGALVMIHAENDHCIHYLSAQLDAKGTTSLDNYPAMAPSAVEREATHRAITLSEITGAPILLVHVSAREAMQQIRWARDRGLRVRGETCPQYLVLDAEELKRPGWEAAKYLCAPPLRDQQSRDALWRGLASGVLQVLSSDHCSYMFDSRKGKKVAGPEPHVRRVPPGLPGMETRLPLVFSEGVGKGRIDLNTFVAVTASNPAKIYGLYPRKGTIAVGSDADIAIWDPEREVTIRHDMLHDRMDFTPYEGITVKGWPVMVLSRGDVIVDDGKVTAASGRGRFLRCDRLQE